MKKVILSIVVVAALATSCKKDYKCVCTITYTGALAGQGGGTESYTIHDTKSKAKTACNNEAATVSGGGAGETVTCAIQ